MKVVDERGVQEVLKRLEVGRTYNVGTVAVHINKAHEAYGKNIYSLYLNNHAILNFTKPTEEFVVWRDWVRDFGKIYNYTDFILTNLSDHLAELETVQSAKYIENATRKIEDIGI